MSRTRHNGWFAAHRAHLLLNAAHGIGIVVLANGDSATPKLIADTPHRAVPGTSVTSDTARRRDP